MTSATSPRLSSMTMRMPDLSDSSRSSAMSFDLAFLHQLGDLLEQPRLVHLVRQLGDDDGLAPPRFSSVSISTRARTYTRPRPVR